MDAAPQTKPRAWPVTGLVAGRKRLQLRMFGGKTCTLVLYLSTWRYTDLKTEHESPFYIVKAGSGANHPNNLPNCHKIDTEDSQVLRISRREK